MTPTPTPVDLFDEVLRDPLTGLPIPALQREHLRLALHRARRNGTAVALVIVDLDGLAAVAARFGFVVGDLVLQTLAGRLCSTLRATDVVSRLDDDRFAVVCDDLGAEHDLDRLVNRMRAAVAAPMVVEGHRIELGVAIGTAISLGGTGATQLLHEADAAMAESRRR